MMEKQLNVLDSAQRILQARGRYEPNTHPKYLLLSYRDKNIAIVAYISVATGDMEEMYIGLPLSGGIVFTTIHIGTPFRRGNEPLGVAGTEAEVSSKVWVYHWEKGNHSYFRPGRWASYLTIKAHEIRNLSRQFAGLNGKEIDDSSLFPDFKQSAD